MPSFDDLRQSIDLFNPFGGAKDVRGGRVITDTGRPLQVRDSHSAARRFSLAQQNWHHVPRPKFLFWVRFFGNYFQAFDDYIDENARNRYIQGLSFLVKSVDKPSVTLQTETLHQYNKKRVIYTGMNLEPVTIRFHDDSNNDVLSFWRDYYTQHFGNGRAKQVLSYSYDQTFAAMHGQDWGFSPSTTGSPNMTSHYLSHIEIYEFFGGRITQIDLINPKISRFDHDNSDYSDTSGTGEIGMTLEYEGLIYAKNNAPIGDMDFDSLSSLLFDLGDYYQLPEILGNKDLFSWAPERILQDATTALIQGKVPKARQILTGVLGETIPLRRDQIRGIVEGAVGNLGQRALTGVLSGRGFSFGDTPASTRELAGYQANEFSGVMNDTAAQIQARALRDQTIMGTIQDFIPGVASSAIQQARGLIDSGSATAKEAFGDVFAMASSEDGTVPGSYAQRDASGTKLTNMGAETLNSVSKPTMAFANNVMNPLDDPTSWANRDY